MFAMGPAFFRQALGGGTDPYFSNVVSLMHFDNNLTDVIGKVWAVTGSITYDTTAPEFGPASAYFSGNGNNIIAGPSSDFAFGTGDFTIEFSFKIPNGFRPAGPYFVDQGSGNYTVISITPGGQICYYDPSSGAGGSLYNNGPVNSTFGDGNWHRIAVSRVSGTVYAFYDGVMWGSGASSHNKTETDFRVNTSAVGSGLTWTIDELRITKGVGRYTANYTPSSTAFPNS